MKKLRREEYIKDSPSLGEPSLCAPFQEYAGEGWGRGDEFLRCACACVYTGGTAKDEEEGQGKSSSHLTLSASCMELKFRNWLKLTRSNNSNCLIPSCQHMAKCAVDRIAGSSL